MGSALGWFFPVGLGDCQARSPLCFKHAASPERQLRPCNTFLKCRNIPSCDALGQQTQAQPFSRTPNHPNTPGSSPDAQRHVHQHRGIETALQICASTVPSTKLANEIRDPGFNEDERRGPGKRRDPLLPPLLEPGVVGQCRSTGASTSPSAPPLLPADGLGARLSRAGREEGVGRELLTEHACKAGDPADTVCFLLCHFSTRTEGKGEKKNKKKKIKGRNIWQAGDGLALLSAEKESFLPKGEEGKVDRLPHTCPSGLGSSTHGWQHASCRLGTNRSHLGKTSLFH